MGSSSPEEPSFDVDTSVANVARVYDYLLGGVDNFAVDREAAERATAPAGGIEKARRSIRANRRFLGRAVRYLAREAGIRQFLDIGTGMPSADNVHGVALAEAPDSRVVYVDNDPVVTAHARVLLRNLPAGAARYVHGDLRDPEGILSSAAATLDLRQPLAVMIVALLHQFPDQEDPWDLVSRYVDAVAPGSYLVLSHLASESEDATKISRAHASNPNVNYTLVTRSRTEVARFFEGLDLVGPGVVLIGDWRPDPLTEADEDTPSSRLLGAVGRKP